MRNLRALVDNAADKKQLDRAKRILGRRKSQLTAAIRGVMETEGGRLVFRTLLDQAGTEESEFSANGSQMYFYAGRRHFGFEIRAMLIDADDLLFEAMEREARARERRDSKEVEAGHAAFAAETEGETDA